jgi:hypothetical protein
MSRSLRRGALAATAIAFPLAALSACAAGNSASTLQVKPDTAATAVGGIKIQNVNVITEPDGAQGPAVVTAKIFNDGPKDETLDSITLPDSGDKVKLSPAEGRGPLTVPAGGSLVLGGEGNPSAVIAKSSEATRNGDVQGVVFQLSETGKVKLTAIVVPATGYYEDFGPTVAPGSSRTSPSPAAGEDSANGDNTDASDSPSADESADH